MDWTPRKKDTLCEIVPHLFISSYEVAQNKELLVDSGITHVVNASGLGNPHIDCFEYMSIAIDDDESTDISKHFPKCCRFICDALVRKGKVLVNCYAGISRSCTLLVAFLIRKRKMSLRNAMELVISKRPQVDPNEGFRRQLKEWEEHCAKQKNGLVTHTVYFHKNT